MPSCVLMLSLFLAWRFDGTLGCSWWSDWIGSVGMGGWLKRPGLLPGLAWHGYLLPPGFIFCYLITAIPGGEVHKLSAALLVFRGLSTIFYRFGNKAGEVLTLMFNRFTVFFIGFSLIFVNQLLFAFYCWFFV